MKKYYYLDFGNSKVSITEEEVLEIRKILNNPDLRFFYLKRTDEDYAISSLKGIKRDFEKEDMEEKNKKLKEQMGQKDQVGLKNLNELKNRFGLGQNDTDNTKSG